MLTLIVKGLKAIHTQMKMIVPGRSMGDFPLYFPTKFLSYYIVLTIKASRKLR